MCPQINTNHISDETSDSVVFGNPDIYSGKAIVAFIDILGYTTSLLSNWGVHKNSPISSLLDIRKKVINYNNTNPGMRLRPFPPELPPNKDYTYRTVIHSISDSFTVSSALPNDLHSWHVIMGYVAAYNAIRVIQHTALSMGFVLRGGVEIADVYWDEGLIMGPAYISAVNIESKIAHTARIVVGPNLIEQMKFIMSANEHFYKEPMSLDNILSMFRVLNCSDGLVMMNPSHDPIESPKRGSTHINLYKKIKHLKRKCNSKKTKEKYTELLSFYSNLDKPDFASISDLEKSVEHILKRFDDINLNLISDHDLTRLAIESGTARNSPCPCGSGNKYKRCHGKLL